MALDVLKELAALGAVIENQHFIYTSGKHGSAYINLDPMFPDVELVSKLADELIAPYLGQVDTVVAPATGGIVLAVQCGLAFARKNQHVAAIWADKDGKEFAFERSGFTQHVTGKRVLVVEDLLNTGGSVEKACRLVEANGGNLVAASVVCNRGVSTAESLGVPHLSTLATVTLSMFDPETCELCSQERPIAVDIGHGAAFKQAHPNYAGGFTSLIS